MSHTGVTRTRTLRMHPKMSSTLESRVGRVRVAGKPSDEPLRKGETQSPDVSEMSASSQNSYCRRPTERWSLRTA